jgi:sugar fermentation stimulation protein A
MKYDETYRSEFISRPNRFIAKVLLDGKPVFCHVKNTGRCKELLVPGAEVVLAASSNKNRKTRYDLVCVYKGDRLVNIDSQAPNRVFQEWIDAGCFLQGVTFVKPEYRFNGSRLDFYLEAGGKRVLVEVKGVTLEENGIVLFPDAPTERGVRHIHELVEALGKGYDESYIVFIIQMKNVDYFSPNYKTHSEFGEALKAAAEQGVKVLALDCNVTPHSITPGKLVEVRLQNTLPN